MSRRNCCGVVCGIFDGDITLPPWESTGTPAPTVTDDVWATHPHEVSMPSGAEIELDTPAPTTQAIGFTLAGVHTGATKTNPVASSFELELHLGSVSATFSVTAGTTQTVVVTLSSGGSKSKSLFSDARLKDYLTLSLQVTEHISAAGTEYRTCATISDASRSVVATDYSGTIPSFAAGDIKIASTAGTPILVNATITQLQSTTGATCPSATCVPVCETRCAGRRIKGISVVVSGIVDATDHYVYSTETVLGTDYDVERWHRHEGMAGLNGTYLFPLEVDFTDPGDPCFIRKLHATSTDVTYTRKARGVPAGDPMSGPYTTEVTETHTHQVARSGLVCDDARIPAGDFFILLDSVTIAPGIGGDMGTFAGCTTEADTSGECWWESEIIADGTPGSGCGQFTPHIGAKVRCEYSY